jgi:hypothetical protein
VNTIICLNIKREILIYSIFTKIKKLKKKKLYYVNFVIRTSYGNSFLNMKDII